MDDNGNGEFRRKASDYFDGMIGRGVRFVGPLVLVPMVGYGIGLANNLGTELSDITRHLAEQSIQLRDLADSVRQHNTEVDQKIEDARTAETEIARAVHVLEEADARREGLEDRFSTRPGSSRP